MLITAALPAALEVSLVSVSGRESGGIRVALASQRETVPCAGDSAMLGVRHPGAAHP